MAFIFINIQLYHRASGDLMGRAMKNLDKLLAMPYGCGEQNMVLFAPNIFILNYLKSTGQLTQQIQDKATRFLESGRSTSVLYIPQFHCSFTYHWSNIQSIQTLLFKHNRWSLKCHLFQPRVQLQVGRLNPGYIFFILYFYIIFLTFFYINNSIFWISTGVLVQTKQV